MEKADHELLMKFISSDTRLKNLYNEHLRLEKEVTRFDRYRAYSPSAALRQKELKVKKLKGMDDMMAILNEYRQSNENGGGVVWKSAVNE